LNASLCLNFISKQWADEQNSTELVEHTTLDLRISRQFLKRFVASIDIQNLTDLQYIDKKGGLAPGRFIELNLGVKF
jgi:outer membrane receptor protein involved in Fe transport